MSESITKHLQ